MLRVSSAEETTMHDYQTKGCSQFGAQMGRRSERIVDMQEPFILLHVPLDGDYDSGGAYWGGPNNLYCVEDTEGRVFYMRASNPAQVRAAFPENAEWVRAPAEVSEADLNEMLDGYITCALWSTSDESDESGGEPFDKNYSAEDLATEARAAMLADCKAFASAHVVTIVACFGLAQYDWARVGHDFWLSRNGHGAGFNDGDWPEAYSERLSTAAEAMGEVNLYLGDDGKIYQ